MPDGITKRLIELPHLTIDTTSELLAMSSPVSQFALAAELAQLIAESHRLRSPQRHSIRIEHHPRQPLPASKGKATVHGSKHKKKQPSNLSQAAVAAPAALPATASGAGRTSLALATPTASGERTTIQPNHPAAHTSDGRATRRRDK